MQSGNQTLDGYLDRFDDAADRLAGVLATGDLSAPVPACPGWTLADLGAHVGEIHQWAEHAVVAGNPNAEHVPAPEGQAALVDWYRRSAGSVSATLRRTAGDAPAWNFGPKPRTAGFWHRRQAHETTIHLADALATQGVTPELDDEEFARDGLTEVFEMFLPRQERLGRLTWPPHVLSLHTGADWWMLGPSEGEFETGATVAAAPSALLLLVWGRIGLDDPRLTVTGDRKAAHAVLSAGLVP